MGAEVSASGESLRGEAGSVLFRRHWGWLLAFAIVQIVAGSLAISVPPLASLVAVAVYGATSAALALACRKKQKETPRGDSPSGHAAATA